MDLIAVDLKEGLDALSEVTGEISSEDLLDHIFKNFCVGKQKKNMYITKNKKNKNKTMGFHSELNYGIPFLIYQIQKIKHNIDSNKFF